MFLSTCSISTEILCDAQLLVHLIHVPFHSISTEILCDALLLVHCV